jgi:hypothetical protein
VSKQNIAAAIAMGRTPVRRAAVPAEEEALKNVAPHETEPVADLKPEPAGWTGAGIFREAWEATKPGAISDKKKPGPQRRPGTFLKRIFTLDRATSDYVNQAWRSYRTRDGHLVDSMSEFVASVLAEHRDRTAG